MRFMLSSRFLTFKVRPLEFEPDYDRQPEPVPVNDLLTSSVDRSNHLSGLGALTLYDCGFQFSSESQVLSSKFDAGMSRSHFPEEPIILV